MRGARATGSSGSASSRSATDAASAAALGTAMPELRAIGVDGARGNPVPAGPGEPGRVDPAVVGHDRGPEGDRHLAGRGAREPAGHPRAVGSHRARQRVLLAAAVPRHGPHRHGHQRAAHRRDAATSGRPRASCAARAAGSRSLGELGVTVAIAPPFALELVTRRWRRRGGDADLSSVRHLLVGAEQIRPEVIEGFAEVFEPLRAPARRALPDLRPGRRRRSRSPRSRSARKLPHRRRRSAPLGVVRSADPGRHGPARPRDERAARAHARRR